jgi:hypothetical protein
MNRFTIITVCIVIISLACSLIIPIERNTEAIYKSKSTYTYLPSNTKTIIKTITKTTAITITPTKTKEKVVEVFDLRYISSSPLLNDNRIWAMKPLVVEDEGSEETGCHPEIRTGDIYQSNDGGYSWEFVAPPVILRPNYCIIKQYIVDKYSSMEVVPYGKGFIIQFKLIPGPLPSLTPLLYWMGSDWYLIPSPIRSYKQGDPKESGLQQMVIGPDGSGRIFAVGDDPDSLSNAWVLEEPTGHWRDISSKVDHSSTITRIFWSYAFGLIGRNSYSIIQLQNDKSWIDLQFPNDIVPSSTNIWMGIDGEICTNDYIMPENTPSYGWNGSEWVLFNHASNCIYHPLGIAYQQFAIIGDSIDSALSTILKNIPEIYELNLPRDAHNNRILSLAVSQTGITYLLYEVGLYASNDIGQTWRLVYN